MPTNTALATNPSSLYTGVLTPTVPALSSSSRMATRPMPNFVLLIRQLISSDSPSSPAST